MNQKIRRQRLENLRPCTVTIEKASESQDETIKSLILKAGLASGKETKKMLKNNHKQALRCAIYLRVSTEHQVDHGESLETQKTQLDAYAQLHQWKVVKTYQDAGISAKNTDRPAFQEMMKDAESGKFDVVMVTKVDRISRNLVDLCQLVNRLDEQGIAFVSASQQFDTTAALGKLVLGILG
jgi:predicted site-specific integrase-resolvase